MFFIFHIEKKPIRVNANKIAAYEEHSSGCLIYIDINHGKQKIGTAGRIVVDESIEEIDAAMAKNYLMNFEI